MNTYTPYGAVAKQERLREAVRKSELSYELVKQAALRSGTKAPVRHKCFVTFHSDDIDAVTTFVEDFSDVFIPRVVGVSDSDLFKDPIDSRDEDYIKKQIRERYLTDSTVTILFVGKCAWSRKFIDWELSSTLRNDPLNKRSGLLAITPKDKSVHRLPDRFNDNWNSQSASYASFNYYPTSKDILRAAIEDAFNARTSRSSLVDNTRKLRTYNSSC